MDAAVRKKWLARGGYSALAVFSFVYFLYLGFPFDRVLPRVLETYKKELGGMKIEAGTIRAGWLFSLVATDVKVFSAPRRSGSTDEQQQPTVKLERVVLKAKPLSLITGKLGVKLDALLYGGRVRGSVVKSSTVTAVDLVVDGVEIAKYPALSSYGANLSGQIAGTVNVALDFEDGTRSSGRIDLSVRNPRMEESNLILFKLPTTVFDKGGAAVIDIKDGKIDLADVGLRGTDLELAVEGNILLKKRLSSSQWSAASVIRASNAWKSQVAGFDNIVGPGRCADGSYRYKIAGVLGGFPRTLPDRGCR